MAISDYSLAKLKRHYMDVVEERIDSGSMALQGRVVGGIGVLLTAGLLLFKNYQHFVMQQPLDKPENIITTTGLLFLTGCYLVARNIDRGVDRLIRREEILERRLLEFIPQTELDGLREEASK